MSNVVRVIADVKTELIQRLASRDQLRSLEREIQDFKEAAENQKRSSYKSTLVDEDLSKKIRDAIEYAESIPTQLQALQLQILRNETCCFDVDSLVHSLDRRFSEFQKLNRELEHELELLHAESDFQQIQRTELLQQIKSYVQKHFLSQDESQSFK